MNKKFFSMVLVLACVAAGIYFRFYAVSLPVLGLVAQQEIFEEESKAIEKMVEDKYQDMSVLARNKLAQRVIKENFSGNNPELDMKVNHRASELKERFQDEQGYVYLNGIDSYYWLRLLENLITKGHIGDRVVDGIEYDDLIGAPIDGVTNKNMHIWLGFIFYKAASFFQPNVPLTSVLFYVPVFLSVIIGVFSFFVARRLGADELGAFFACAAINLSPFFLERSIGEWFDTDIYNVLFPLLVFGTFLFCFKNRNILARIFFSSLSGLFLACYASTWKGWWFIFDIMLFSYLIYILNLKLASADEDQSSCPVHRAEGTRDHLFLISFFFFVSSLFVIWLNGFGVWKDFILEPLHLWNILKVTAVAMWPNVYRTVAELKGVNSFELMTILGGASIFFTALIGLIYLFLFKKAGRDEQYGMGILTIIFWIIAIFCATLQAFRFALLLVVPLGLAFGLSFTVIYKLVEEKVKKISRRWIALLLRFSVVAVFSGHLFFNIADINTRLVPLLPQMTDEWYGVLSKIKNETPDNAIINSWWDYGHWFKALAVRRVLFDGMTQNTPYAYWMAQVLLSDSEDRAVGILRMINANDNKAVDFLEKQEGIDLVKAVAYIQEACVKKDAKNASDYLLKEGLSAQVAQEVASLLFPQKLPPVYFIVSHDMVAKVGAITYIGNWDFQKVDMWFKSQELPKEDFLSYAITQYGLSPAQAQEIDLEISLLGEDETMGWFSKVLQHTSPLSKLKKKDGNLLFFENGLSVDLGNHHCYVSSEFQEKAGTPKSLFYMQDDKLMEASQDGSDKAFGALLVSKGESDESMLMDPSFIRSMLTRLYFFKGRGLKHFKLFAEAEDKDGNAIYCYKIEWPQDEIQKEKIRGKK
ncbi:MAG: STT3 domain-containing protein [Candidatus Omnitrophota bacterium]